MDQIRDSKITHFQFVSVAGGTTDMEVEQGYKSDDWYYYYGSSEYTRKCKH